MRADDCCSRSFQSNRRKFGYCEGCIADAQCPEALPICHVATGTCRCSTSSCFGNNMCLNENYTEVEAGKPGMLCACDIRKGKPVNCKTGEICSGGRTCIP